MYSSVRLGKHGTHLSCTGEGGLQVTPDHSFTVFWFNGPPKAAWGLSDRTALLESNRTRKGLSAAVPRQGSPGPCNPTLCL